MTTLVDTYSRHHTYLRISVTERCNMRCVYCMPATGIALKHHNEILRYDEIERLVRIGASLGIRKVRITGGEPLVRKGLVNLVQSLANVPGIETLAMTTNGVLLHRYAHELHVAGLHRLNVSLDTLRPDRFERVTLRSFLDDVLLGIDTALHAGFTPLKLNVVVMRSMNDDELPDFVEFARCRPVNVRFIEYMPFTANKWAEGGFIPYNEMLERLRSRYEVIPILSEDASDVAKNYFIPGVEGNISFITSMSQHFCGSCNRLRITADGSIKPCLFSPIETNIRSHLRNGATDEMIADELHRALKGKPYEHLPMQELAEAKNRTMIQIGG